MEAQIHIITSITWILFVIVAGGILNDMEYLLIIPGRLSSLNQYIDHERANKYKGASLKKKNEKSIGIAIKECLKGIEISVPVEMHYLWIVPNKRTDRDNVAFAKKFVQDALVKCGVLKDDGWDHVVGFSDMFEVDKENPRIEVLIREVES